MNIPPVSTTMSMPSAPSPVANDAASVRQEARPVMTPQSPVQERPATSASGEKPLKEAVEKVQEYIQPFNNNLEFSINKDTERLVVKVVDQSTKEVIRQIPSEEMLAIAKALDSLKGLLVRQTA